MKHEQFRQLADLYFECFRSVQQKFIEIFKVIHTKGKISRTFIDSITNTLKIC